eukprot:NODE_5690_length_624_cov_24.090543_g5526_i0.p1 GENE.NODE_5690_length_624_cov_24.090543_g5526_i0~~NODE_5690_length_624_cov_24.090543_g5526_i0.p1  ORF type:complete len:185 (+),score=15.92 NODE_5690_length_624_cov_24.090543_g5526_i0:23-577(+)
MSGRQDIVDSIETLLLNQGPMRAVDIARTLGSLEDKKEIQRILYSTPRFQKVEQPQSSLQSVRKTSAPHWQCTPTHPRQTSPARSTSCLSTNSSIHLPSASIDSSSDGPIVYPTTSKTCASLPPTIQNTVDAISALLEAIHSTPPSSHAALATVLEQHDVIHPLTSLTRVLTEMRLVGSSGVEH